MRYLKVLTIRKMIWLLCLSLSILSPSFSFADDGDEVIQELRQNCEPLAKDMARQKISLSSC